jgi:hypothetical protein
MCKINFWLHIDRFEIEILCSYFSQNVIRMRWAGYITCLEEKTAQRVLVGKPEAKETIWKI